MNIPVPSSRRYANTPTATLTTAGGAKVVYLERRIVPLPSRFAALQYYLVQTYDRLDNIANAFYGDPEIYWLICDANGALEPEELEQRDRVLRITMPEGFPAPANA